MVACYGRPRKHICGEAWESSVKSAIAKFRDDTAEGATWTLFHNDLTKARKREEFIMQSHLLLVNDGQGGPPRPYHAHSCMFKSISVASYVLTATSL